jgi:hypothetical protein
LNAISSNWADSRSKWQLTTRPSRKGNAAVVASMRQIAVRLDIILQTIGGRGRMRNFGVWRLAFNVRRQGVWREESGVGFRLVPEERRGRGVSVGPRRSLRGGPNNQVCKDQFGRTALLRHPKVRSATYHSLVRNAASISAWIIFGLMALALSSCAPLSSTPGEPAHYRCSTPGSGDPE